MGLAAFFAALQVYFRDTSSFLPYFVRIWLYLSPVLWMPEQASARCRAGLLTLIELNPMYSMLGGYTELHPGPRYPPLYMWLAARRSGRSVAVVGRVLVLHVEGA